MRKNNIKTLVFLYQCYKKEIVYNFDKNQIKNMFRDLSINDYEQDIKIPRKSRKEFYNYSSYCSDLFSLFFLLNHINYYTEKLEKSIYLKAFDKARKAFDKVYSDFTIIVSLFTKVEIFVRDKFNIDFSFFIFEYNNFFKTLQNSITIYEHGKEEDKYKFFLNYDILQLENRISTYKFFLPLFIIILSPFYNKKYKASAIKLIIVLKKILNKSKLQYIQIQKKNVKFLKRIKRRGHRDGTTRILGIFTRFNDDVYLFRLDFPHAKENAIHINLHEKRKNHLVEAYYPMTNDEIKKFGIPDDLLEKITLYQEGLYWFRSDMKKIVAETSKTKTVQESIDSLYHAQSHFEFEKGRKERFYNKLIKFFIDLLLQLNMSRDVVVEEFNREESKNVEIMETILRASICNDCLIIDSYLNLGFDFDRIKEKMGFSDDRLHKYIDEYVPLLSTEVLQY